MAEVASAGPVPVPTPSEPVPLDTIPISPDGGAENGNGATNGANPADGEIVTVFHDPENFNVKHPLQHKWTLWFTKPGSGKGDNWNELLKEVISFDSVEDFWGIYNNITPTSQLALKSDYHLFKTNVRPEWEDPQNKHGGRWSYSFKERKSIDIDSIWLQVLLAAIGETLEDEGDNEVMGVVVNVRRAFFRIGLWTRTVGKSGPGGQRTNEEGKAVLMKIGARFKEVLGVPAEEQVDFMGHTDSAHSGSTRAKAKITI
ncbi:eukaryotic translation initiation factor 4E [Elasticomyces elasticus]|nr:eukaryotic translation initiation factor 4E [Elasticomyces elasticus]